MESEPQDLVETNKNKEKAEVHSKLSTTQEEKRRILMKSISKAQLKEGANSI